MKKKYTDEQLITAVKNKICLQEVLDELNLIGGHARIKQKIIDLKLDINHWKNFSGTTPRKILSVNELLTTNSTIQSSDLKRRLLSKNYFEYKCSLCHISEWNGMNLSLQLDHINGIHSDNRIENLRLLCPNCHSQTETFCGRNTKGLKRKKENDYSRYPCTKCEKLLICYTNKLKMCNVCRKTEYGGKLTKIQLEQLRIDYNNTNYYIKDICEKYCISRTTLKNLINRGLLKRQDGIN
jgi:Zn finger protein HypA/HybF involved in hydrogenase expression